MAEERGQLLVPGRRLRQFGNAAGPHAAAAEREIQKECDE
jgi:hypothetical protein